MMGPRLLALLLAWTLSAAASDADRFERIYRGGLIVDGSGAAPYPGTVAVRDGRLHLRADDAPDWTAPLDENIAGKVITPAFIDLHTHATGDLLDPERSLMTNYLSQGVGTVVIGNDGGGTIQIARRFADMATHGTGTHVVQYVGHATLRREVMPRTDRAATDEEIDRMRTLLRHALDEGAAGLSSGLFYADGSFATTGEMIALCRDVAAAGGIYDSHIRAESSRGVGLQAAIDEVIEISRESGVPAHIAHIKALGRDVWGQAPAIVARIRAARAEGLGVTADQYPWIASSTQLQSAVLSREWQAGGAPAWPGKLEDPATRDAILEDLRQNIHRRGGPDSLLLLETPDPRWDGLRLSEVADALDLPAEEAAARLIGEGTTRVVSFNMQEDDITVFMAEPWVATSSDGTDGHPRKYGSFSRKYRRYVQELKVLSLAQFVRSSSGLAADILDLAERGYLHSGYHADLLVFDPDAFRETADFDHWNRHSVGVEHLLVGGTAVIENGDFTRARPGQALRRPTR